MIVGILKSYQKRTFSAEATTSYSLENIAFENSSAEGLLIDMTPVFVLKSHILTSFYAVSRQFPFLKKVGLSNGYVKEETFEEKIEFM